MRKLIFSIGVVAMIVSNCTSKTTELNADQLNIHFPAVDLILDPHKMEDLFSMAVVTQIHRGLLRYSPSGDVLPDLAQEWTENADHTVYTFKLKPAKFSDGQSIRSVHVVASYSRIFASGAAIGADVDYIKGVSEFKKTLDVTKLGIKAKSDSEVEFHLKYPSTLFLKHLAVTDCAILPISKFDEKISFDTSNGYSGPYKVIGLGEDGSVTVERWRDDGLQSRKPPQRIRFFPSSKSAIELTNESATDSLDHDIISPEERERLVKQKWLETPTELIGETYVILNPKKVAKEIREAMAAAISQEDAVNALGSKYTPAWGAIPHGVHGELQKSDYQKASVRKASGTINLEFTPSNPVHVKLYPFLKEKWEAIGLKVNLVPLEKKELLGRVFGSRCEVCIGQKGLDYPDGFSVLTYFKSEYPSNYFHVKSKRIDSMIDEAGKILDKTNREERYRDIQKAVLAEHTLIPIAFGSEASGLWSPKVKSVPPHIIGIHMLPFESIEMRE